MTGNFFSFQQRDWKTKEAGVNLFFHTGKQTNSFTIYVLMILSSNKPPNTDKALQVPVWIWQASWAANDLIYLNSNQLSRFGRYYMKIGNMGVTNTWILRSLSRSDFLGLPVILPVISTHRNLGDRTGYWVACLFKCLAQKWELQATCLLFRRKETFKRQQSSWNPGKTWEYKERPQWENTVIIQ